VKIDDPVYVAGHNGLVGSAILKELKKQGYGNLICKSRQELDLSNSLDVASFFEEEKPEYVFMAAAKVGGIYANNTYPADFIYQNLMVQNNIIHNSYLNGVKKLLFLGSSCIYPKHCLQPMKEEYLLSGPLEPTNEPYAVAKIAGIKMCSSYRRQYDVDFISAMPTNLYGNNDNFDLQNSHVLPALLRKTHEAKISKAPAVTIWGTGSPRREFMYVDDMAAACVFIMKNYSNSEIINIGTGKDVTIRQLAEIIIDVAGYEGELRFDESKPDGMPRKLLDVSKLKSLNWTASTDLKAGIAKTYEWYLSALESGDIRM